jgi:hypothetical protein
LPGHPLRITRERTNPAQGTAVVEESTEDGSVPNLRVINRGDGPLLIPEGEILVGGKQNRVVNVTVLVAAGATFTLPVNCVEQGRWGYASCKAKLKAVRQNLQFPEGTAGIVVAKGNQVIGMDLFDSPRTFADLRDRLVDACLLDFLRDGQAAQPAPHAVAARFLSAVAGHARLRVPALGLGEELEIVGEGLVGAALLYSDRLAHLAAYTEAI